MENLFPILTEATQGIGSMLNMYMEWLLSDGLIFGLLIIVLPLIGKVINILKKLGGK